MPSQFWDRVWELFDDAIDQAPDQRERLLEAGDIGNDVAQEVRRLILWHERSGDFINPPTSAASSLPYSSQVPSGFPEGHAIGAFRIVRAIGSGGMGAVYEAVQENPVRKVAVKVLRWVVASREMEYRFQRESQVLARLRHPGIAQIYTAGIHKEGALDVPYFALEYIENARTLTDFAVDSKSDVNDRLKLVAATCDAVHHGHQRGVVHRDLKPANILVDPSDLGIDGRLPRPRIIDFGIARTMDSDLAATTMRTDAGELLGTLRYMSPEQFDADPHEIDVRSDIYTLGVVLYELLCGHPPYDVKTTSIIHMARVVRNEAPRRLSAIDRRLKGDLEAITLKALEKDRRLRYQSAAEFGEDIRRFLRREPIVARPTTMAYHLRMFALRHRLLCGAAVALMIMMGAATSISMHFAATAERERQASATNAYIANVVAAEAAISVNDVSEARIRLEAAPVEPRSWEWRHLAARLDQSIATFEGHSDSVWSVAFSADGAFVASASGTSAGSDHSIRIWDAATGILHSRLEGNGLPFTGVVFVGESRQLAATSLDGNLRMWNLDTESNPQILLAHSREMARLAASPDGRWLAAGSGDGKIHLQNLVDGSNVAWEGHDASIAALAFSPDSRWLASGAQDNTARIWEVATQIEHRTLVGHSQYVTGVAFSPDGRWIVTASRDKTLRLWDRDTGDVLATMHGHRSDVLAVAFDPLGRWVVSGSRDNTIALWRVPSGEQLTTLRGHNYWVTALACDPEGLGIVTGSPDGSVKLWKNAPREDIAALAGHTGLIPSVSFSPDGKHLASASLDGTVKIWDIQEHSEVRTLDAGAWRMHAVAYHPNGNQLAGGASDGAVVWNAANGEKVLELKKQSAGVLGLAYSPDGKRLATASPDRTVMLWDAQNGEHLATLSGHAGWVWSVAFSPDGRILATGSDDRTVRLWDVAAARYMATLSGHGQRVSSVDFSPDGTRLASASVDKTIKLWDIARRSQTDTLRGHSNAVLAVAFSPDGTRLVSASHDTSIRLWDPATAQAIVTLRGHSHWVHAVSFSPDGSRIASGGGTYEGSDCVVRLWEATPQ
ncbi:MAG: protein kinase domain-containing protein [Planctomycetota bacterium]|jgi:WD40 repeat protein/serine/threonine protein kinase